MISKENINYSIRNLRKNKSRSFLTIFSIFIGITTIFIFISFGMGLYEYIDNTMSSSTANKIVIQSKAGFGGLELSGAFKLTERDLNTINRIPDVERATGMYVAPVQIKKGSETRYTFLMGYDPEEPLVWELFNIDIDRGRWLRARESKNILVGYNYQIDNRIFQRAYDVGDRFNFNEEQARIIGFVESAGNPQDDAQVYITNDYFREVFPEIDYYTMIIAEVDIGNVDQTIEIIEERLRRQRGQEKGKEDFTVQSFQDLIDTYTSSLNIVIGFIILIALISVLVSGVNTANTMITSVLERYREIGVLKSIGAKNSEIFKIFLFESSLLGFIAGVLGVFFGWLITFIIKLILDDFGWSFLSPSYSIYLFIGCIAFSTITGAISGVIPARNASKTNIVDALRYE